MSNTQPFLLQAKFVQPYDEVFIEGLTLLASIGVYDWEQTIKQKLVFDVRMFWDNRTPAKSDDVNDCLNYAAVSETIIAFVTAKPFALIERVAEEVANLLLVEFKLPAVEITLRKPTAVASAQSVGVKIFRTASN